MILKKSEIRIRMAVKLTICLLIFISVASGGQSVSNNFAIINTENASDLEKFAAREIRRYIYLRTGSLLEIIESDSISDYIGGGIILSAGMGPILSDFLDEASLPADSLVCRTGYRINTLSSGGRRFVILCGSCATDILYASYRFAGHLGCGFYLHGDVIPDRKTEFIIPELHERNNPLFELRGILPFHDFPEGPDWWDLNDYRAVISQLPKLGMNFFGLHTYPEGEPNAEPTVWIGLPEDFDEYGNVRSGYPSAYFNTIRGDRGFNWGYESMTTDQFHFGASELFTKKVFCSEVMDGFTPGPGNAEEHIELFNRTKDFYKQAFNFANKLGVKTCVGTHTPVVVPKDLQDRLISEGMDYRDSSIIFKIYKGIYSRILKSYPIDYYWFWTPESWTWNDADDNQIISTLKDLSIALKAADSAKIPFNLATCGWVLGPPSDRTLFDEHLPKSVTASCILREVGKAPVDPAFARIQNRSKWVIPWLEDDGALTQPQLWVGRMRKDAADALRYGCEGLLGIHWRTRIISPNVSALADAGWRQNFKAPEGQNPYDVIGPVGGNHIKIEADSIKADGDPTVYSSMRERNPGYNLKIPNGKYDITLQFCEYRLRTNKARIFDISVQGEKVRSEFDIHQVAGYRNAYDLKLEDVSVDDEMLRIEFTERIRYPIISGIIIGNDKFVKKINCGGAAYEDYEADWPESVRYLESDDFYFKWAENLFGLEEAGLIAKIFSDIDGNLPVVSVWIDGPGGIKADYRNWEEVKNEYRFIEKLDDIHKHIEGSGNKDRFEYWLNNFYCMREMAKLSCLWGEYLKIIEDIKYLHDNSEKRKHANDRALPKRIEMIGSVKNIFHYLVSTVSNKGELGTIANWEQNILPDIIHKPGEDLKKFLGAELPPNAILPAEYEGELRIIMPTIRTCIEKGDALKLEIIILSTEQPELVYLHWRELGKGVFNRLPFQHIEKGVYRVEIPERGLDLEYFIRVKTADKVHYFPGTAPELNNTVTIF